MSVTPNHGSFLGQPFTCQQLEGCGQCCVEPIIVPYDDSVMAPFVTATILQSGYIVTVGNQSSPPLNRAVIKSFRFSMGTKEGGSKFEMVVVDEAGSDFQRFFDHIGTAGNPEKVADASWINITWGWIGQACDGTTQAYETVNHTFYMMTFDIDYSEGLTKFTIHGENIPLAVLEASNFDAIGDSDAIVDLKDAIEALCEKNKMTVSYRRRDDAESTDAWDFANEPQGVWLPKGRNWLHSILMWISSFRTDAGKGVTWEINSEHPPGTLDDFILWEDPSTSCGESLNNNLIIGTYLVNAGGRSAVLDFKPRVTVNAVTVTAGDDDDPVDAADPGEEDADIADNCRAFAGDPEADPRPGLPIWDHVSDVAIRVYGVEQVAEQARKAGDAHTRANPTYATITGELRLQGDPNMAHPIKMFGKWVSIIVIQPFTAQFTGDACSEWIQTDSCNRVFTNRGWLVLGTAHEIADGNYTTTLSVELVAAPIDVAGSPLGGDNICGYTTPSL